MKSDNIVWNIWVLLSLPAVWLAWAAIDFCIAIFLLLWTMGPDTSNTGQSPLGTSQLQVTFQQPAPTASFMDMFGPRIAVTSTLLVGIIHIFLVIKTFLAWSGARNTIDFVEQRLEEGKASRNGMAHLDSIQLPSGSRKSSTTPLPTVSNMHDKIPRSPEEEEQGILLGVITPQRP